MSVTKKRAQPAESTLLEANKRIRLPDFHDTANFDIDSLFTQESFPAKNSVLDSSAPQDTIFDLFDTKPSSPNLFGYSSYGTASNPLSPMSPNSDLGCSSPFSEDTLSSEPSIFDNRPFNPPFNHPSNFGSCRPLLSSAPPGNAFSHSTLPFGSSGMMETIPPVPLPPLSLPSLLPSTPNQNQDLSAPTQAQAKTTAKKQTGRSRSRKKEAKKTSKTSSTDSDNTSEKSDPGQALDQKLADKDQAAREKNKRSAAEYRRRRKNLMKGLEEQVTQLSSVVQDQKAIITSLNKEKALMAEQMSYLKQLLGLATAKSAPGVCMFVLLACFLLWSPAGDIGAVGTGRGRALLGTNDSDNCSLLVPTDPDYALLCSRTEEEVSEEDIEIFSSIEYHVDTEAIDMGYTETDFDAADLQSDGSCSPSSCVSEHDDDHPHHEGKCTAVSGDCSTEDVTVDAAAPSSDSNI